MAKYIGKAMSITTFKIKQCKLATTVTVFWTLNVVCTNVRAKPFQVHENQCTQILNLPSPVQGLNGTPSALLKDYSGTTVKRLELI